LLLKCAFIAPLTMLQSHNNVIIPYSWWLATYIKLSYCKRNNQIWW